MLLSIGYEGRDPDALVGELVAAGVEVLVDVRRTPRSRKPGMSRRALTERLAVEGIAYRHDGRLGTHPGERPAFRDDRLEQARASLAARLRREAEDALADLSGLARERCVAVLCLEREPARCHRAVVCAEVVARAPEVAVQHL